MTAHIQATPTSEQSVPRLGQGEMVSFAGGTRVVAEEGLPEPRPSEKPQLSREERRRLIAERAYFKAEKRGFAPGHEEKDWLEAEEEFKGISEYWID
jgi:hypothetical protein